MGKDCGKTHFGLEWTIERKRFDAEVSKALNKEQLRLFAAQLPMIDSRIGSLRSGDRAASWVLGHVTSLKNPSVVSPAVVSVVSGLIKRRSGTITRARLKSDNEMQIEPNASRFVDEVVGVLHGFEVLLPENDLRELVAVQLIQKRKEFDNLDFDALTAAELRKWAKWADSVTQSIEQAESTLESGRIFFVKENLLPLCEVISVGKEREQFLVFLKKLAD